MLRKQLFKSRWGVGRRGAVGIVSFGAEPGCGGCVFVAVVHAGSREGIGGDGAGVGGYREGIGCQGESVVWELLLCYGEEAVVIVGLGWVLRGSWILGGEVEWDSKDDYLANHLWDVERMRL